MSRVSNQTSTAVQAPFQFQMTDEAVVWFEGPGQTPGDVLFLDRGYMKVDISQLTIAGNVLHLPGGLDGVFLHYYDGYGVQHTVVDPTSQKAVPTSADYTTEPGKTLHYELVGYKGSPTFLPGASADGQVTGIKQVVLADGDLLNGHLNFVNGGGGGIDGTFSLSMQVGGKTVGALNLLVHHTGFGPNPDAQPLTGPQPGIALHDGNVIATFVPLNA